MLLTRTPRGVHEAMHNSLCLCAFSNPHDFHFVSSACAHDSRQNSLSLSRWSSLNPWFWLQHVPSHHCAQVPPMLTLFFKLCPICFPCPFATYKTSYYVPSCSLLKWHLCHFSLLHPISRALRSNAQHPTCQSIRRFLLRIMSLHAGFWIAIHAIATLFLMYLLI